MKEKKHRKFTYHYGVSGFDRNVLKAAINEIIRSSWGDFGEEYVDQHILTCDHLLFSLEEGVIVGFAGVRSFHYRGRLINYLEFTAVLPKHQSKRLSIELNKRIFIRLFFNSLFSGSLRLRTITISPNPRVLGTIYRHAQYCFPDPKLDSDASDFVWGLSEELLKTIGDPYDSHLRKNNIVEGFYNGSEQLIYDVDTLPKDKDRAINSFSIKNLEPERKAGREFIIYAEYWPWNLI